MTDTKPATDYDALYPVAAVRMAYENGLRDGIAKERERVRAEVERRLGLCRLYRDTAKTERFGSLWEGSADEAALILALLDAPPQEEPELGRCENCEQDKPLTEMGRTQDDVLLCDECAREIAAADRIAALEAENAKLRERVKNIITPRGMAVVPIADLDALREAAKAVLASGKRSFDHPAIHYDEWQVDHDDENALRAALSRIEEER